MKVLITHSWSEDNSGDFAIESAIVKLLYDIYDTKKLNKIVFYSLFSQNDERFLTHSEEKLKLKNTLVIGSLWGTPPINYSYIRKIIYIINSFIYTTFILLSVLLQFRILKKVYFVNNKVKNFIESDLVIIKGGTFIYSPKGISGFIFVGRIFFPIILSIILKKKIIIAPHSFGPFNNKILNSFIFKILKKVDLILCREYISVKLLKSNGCSNIKYCPDMVFYLYEDTNIKNKLNNDKFKIAITARPLDSISTKNVYNNYIEQLKSFINIILSEGIPNYSDVEIHLIPQVIGPDKREDDYNALINIYNDIQLKNKVILYPRLRRTPTELIKIYSEMNLIIGTRMHSIIFGFLSGVPSIAISYYGPKHEGIMNNFNMNDYIFSINNIDHKKILEKVKIIAENRNIGIDIIKNVKLNKMEIFNTFKNLIS